MLHDPAKASHNYDESVLPAMDATADRHCLVAKYPTAAQMEQLHAQTPRKTA